MEKIPLSIDQVLQLVGIKTAQAYAANLSLEEATKQWQQAGKDRDAFQVAVKIADDAVTKLREENAMLVNQINTQQVFSSIDRCPDAVPIEGIEAYDACIPAGQGEEF